MPPRPKKNALIDDGTEPEMDFFEKCQLFDEQKKLGAIWIKRWEGDEDGPGYVAVVKRYISPDTIRQEYGTGDYNLKVVTAAGEYLASVSSYPITTPLGGVEDHNNIAGMTSREAYPSHGVQQSPAAGNNSIEGLVLQALNKHMGTKTHSHLDDDSLITKAEHDRALGVERERNDAETKAVALEAKLDAMSKQLEEMKSAPPSADIQAQLTGTLFSQMGKMQDRLTEKMDTSATESSKTPIENMRDMMEFSKEIGAAANGEPTSKTWEYIGSALKEVFGGLSGVAEAHVETQGAIRKAQVESDIREKDHRQFLERKQAEADIYRMRVLAAKVTGADEEQDIAPAMTTQQTIEGAHSDADVQGASLDAATEEACPPNQANADLTDVGDDGELLDVEKKAMRTFITTMIDTRKLDPTPTPADIIDMALRATAEVSGPEQADECLRELETYAELDYTDKASFDELYKFMRRNVSLVTRQFLKMGFKMPKVRTFVLNLLREIESLCAAIENSDEAAMNRFSVAVGTDS